MLVSASLCKLNSGIAPWGGKYGSSLSANKSVELANTSSTLSSEYDWLCCTENTVIEMWKKNVSLKKSKFYYIVCLMKTKELNFICQFLKVCDPFYGLLAITMPSCY